MLASSKDVKHDVTYRSVTTGEQKRKWRLEALVLLLFLSLALGGLGWYLYGRYTHSGHRPVVVNIDGGRQKKDDTGVSDKAPLREFVPTNEWQVVPENAVLPAGLEISIDFRTGVKQARLLQPTHDIHHNLPMSPGKNMLEQRLENVLSSDAAIQLAALQALDLEAHFIDMGVLIARADNFPNLISLLACTDKQQQQLAGDIIEACLHLNGPAVDAALMSPLVERVVGRLAGEEDAEMQRRLLNILTFAAEGCLEGLVYQFNRAGGFDILKMLLAGGLTEGKPPNPQTIVRVLAFLATVAPIEDANKERALLLLQKYLSLAKGLEFNSSRLNPFEKTCQLPEARRLSEVRKFCESYGK